MCVCLPGACCPRLLHGVSEVVAMRVHRQQVGLRRPQLPQLLLRPLGPLLRGPLEGGLPAQRR